MSKPEPRSIDRSLRQYILDPDDPEDIVLLGQAIADVMQQSYPGSRRVAATGRAMAKSFAQPIARAYVDAKRGGR